MLSCSGLTNAGINGALAFDAGVEMIGPPVIAAVAFLVFFFAVRRVFS